MPIRARELLQGPITADMDDAAGSLSATGPKTLGRISAPGGLLASALPGVN